MPLVLRMPLVLILLVLSTLACGNIDPAMNDYRRPTPPGSRGPSRYHPDFGDLDAPFEQTRGVMTTRPQTRSIRSGNWLRLPGSPNGVPFGTFGGIPTQIMQLDLADIDPAELHKQGSWVLTVQAHVKYPDDLDPGDVAIAPLVCDLQLGAGGVTTDLEVDAVPGFTVPLAAGSFKASFRWDTMPVLSAGASEPVPPEYVDVYAVAQRSTAETSAHRSFLLNRGTLAEDWLTIGRVPPHATGVQLYGSNVAIYANNAGLFLAEGQNAGLLSVDGPDLLAAVQAGVVFAVPSYSVEWTYQADAGGPPGPDVHARVDFTLDL